MSYHQLFVHCVWATYGRLPFIEPHIEKRLYAAISAKCKELHCHVIAIGGIANHVHLLVRFPTTLSIADLVQQVKGSSSHFVNSELIPDYLFRWQEGYGAFTIDKRNIAVIALYIRNQKIHHQEGRLIDELERIENGAPG